MNCLIFPKMFQVEFLSLTTKRDILAFASLNMLASFPSSRVPYGIRPMVTGNSYLSILLQRYHQSESCSLSLVPMGTVLEKSSDWPLLANVPFCGQRYRVLR